MRTPKQIESGINREYIGETLYAFIQPLIERAYYLGYNDACDMHTNRVKTYDEESKP